MGFFTRTSKVKKSSTTDTQNRKPSFTDPPNVYQSRPQTSGSRGNDQRPQQQGRQQVVYQHHQHPQPQQSRHSQQQHQQPQQQHQPSRHHQHPPPSYHASPYPNRHHHAAGASQPHLPVAAAHYSQHHGNYSQQHFQPAGYLTSPLPLALPSIPHGWDSAAIQHHQQAQQQHQQPPPPSYSNHQQQSHQQQVIVNQHYYIGGGQPQHHHAPPLPPYASQQRQDHPYGSSSLGRFTSSMVNLATQPINELYDGSVSAMQAIGAKQLVTTTTAVYDQVATRLDNVMTMIDSEKFSGNEKDLFVCRTGSPQGDGVVSTRGSRAVASTDRSMGKSSRKPSKDRTKSQGTVTAAVSGNYFSKVELYANSKLPKNLPPLVLYMPTWPLLCLAAQYSQSVYAAPSSRHESSFNISSSILTGTKAMCIKSVPQDDIHTIVFAIRGTATFMDWAVNLNTAPTSPAGFLDDTGNLCHAGFLSVAKKMIKPVAARLRQLLQEDPERANYSLLITGHSAGGAVAALLYSHMLARSGQAESELNLLTGCFKRVHCVTFGAPPLSLLPLTKPDGPEMSKSLFLSFVNEGDPVVRADKAYVKSLLELLANPPPSVASSTAVVVSGGSSGKKKDESRKSSLSDKKSSKPSASSSARPSKSKHSASSSRTDTLPTSSTMSKPVWPVPPATLSIAGRIVILRSANDDSSRKSTSSSLKARFTSSKSTSTTDKKSSSSSPKSSSSSSSSKDFRTVSDRLKEGVVAVTCAEEQLRGVVWGDPVAHVMRLYKGRVEMLAVEAVTGRK